MYFRHGRKRRALSEVVGAIMAIAVTLIAGAATWSYVRTQATTSELAVQANVVNTNNYLNEAFRVIDMYFGSTTTTTFWVYNTGAVPMDLFSVRLYDSAGQINLLYNFTQSGGTKTDYVYDLRSSLSGKCKTAATVGPYESPLLAGIVVKLTNSVAETLTVPPTQTNCPSFGQTFTNGTTYSVVVTGLYGNVITYYQIK